MPDFPDIRWTPAAPALPPARATDIVPPESPVQHWLFLGLAVAVLLASVVLRVDPAAQRVRLPLIGREMPGTCLFRTATGIDCPGCGMTRAFVCLAHGDVAAAWGYNPASLLLFALVAAQVPYRVMQLVRLRHGQPALHWARLDKWILGVLLVLLLVQWLARAGMHGLAGG